MKAIMAAVLACGLAACAADDPFDDPVVTSTADEPADPGVPADPGEQSEPGDPGESDDSALAANCVFIDWCNHPDPVIGTVCVVRSSCRSQCTPIVAPGIIAECTADANAVCGGITQSARIVCQ